MMKFLRFRNNGIRNNLYQKSLELRSSIDDYLKRKANNEYGSFC